ncbi:MAG TPA: hypothetical protein VHT29_14385 [Solirubrobacteraceae bacterium]|jgi:hypothetical protein|nr:hypothetical protein [Solirubrobacteraceae bacterium]
MMALAALMATCLGGALPGAAEGASSWRSAPALAAAPPPGVPPAPYPVPVGEVGQISFWAPNRGLLITGGTLTSKGSIAPGVYAYDGSSWHQLSTVCGGAEGRIAWAGPDEFWTISDQRPGQALAPGQASPAALHSISLCHFLDGQVVGSYAMPLEQANSYQQMNSAACYSPSDCWFGGGDGRSPNTGAFHLHWDGSEVSAVYEPEGHAVTGIAELGGQLYESVQIAESDPFLPEESTTHPAVIHTIASGEQTVTCEGVESPFCDFTLFSNGPLPEYGKGVLPTALQGFDLASNGLPYEGGGTQLWATADPVEGDIGSSAAASTTLLLGNSAGEWSQIVPREHETSPLGGVTLGGAPTVVHGHTELGTSGAIAPEPGTEGVAWLSLRDGGQGAEVARLDVSEGKAELTQTSLLPEAGEPEPVGYRGHAGPITCPAANDCWLATTTGWLFHLTDGTQLEPNTDPFFDGEDGVITFRPSDGGVPVIYPDLPPFDDSLINQQTLTGAGGLAEKEATPSAKRRVAGALLEHVKSKLVKKRTIVISFTLTARARVQLIGRRKHAVVAKSRLESLKRGHHTLSLKLDAARWPTAIQFRATPLEAVPSVEVGSTEGGKVAPPIAGNTVET